MKSFIGSGGNIGQIIIEAENRAAAYEQLVQAEGYAAIGNMPAPCAIEDLIEVPRFVDVYAIRHNHDGHPSYTYRRKTATGWEYFTSPEIAYAWLTTQQGFYADMTIQLHPLTVKLEA